MDLPTPSAHKRPREIAAGPGPVAASAASAVVASSNVLSRTHVRPRVPSAEPMRRSTTAASTALVSLRTRTDLDPELADARRRIKLLERDLLAAKADAQVAAAAHEGENKKLRDEASASVSRIRKLENDCAFMLDRDKKLSETIKDMEAKFKEENAKQQLEISKLTSTNRKITEALSVAQERLKDIESASGYEKRMCKQKVEQAQAKIALLTQQNDAESQAKMHALQRIADLEARITSLECEVTSENSRDNLLEASTLRAKLDSQLQQIHALETANASLASELNTLKTAHTSTATLHEQIRTLTLQMDSVPALRERLAAAEVDAAALRAEKQRWAALLNDSDLPSAEATPLAMARALTREKLDRARDREALAEHVGRTAALDRVIEDLHARVAALQSDLAAADDRCAALARSAARLDKARELSRREVAFLRNQMEAMQSGQDENNDKEEMLPRSLMVELEDLLATSTTRIAELETELRAKETIMQQTSVSSTEIPRLDVSKDLREKITVLEGRVEQLSSENALLQKEVENYDRQIGVLEQAIGQGAYDCAKLKVLQFVDNPESKAFAIKQETLNALQAENRALLERLKGSEHGALVPVQVVEAAEIECRRLSKIIDERDKRLMRLREVFAQKSQEFKEVVFSLLGYKVEFQENRVRLISTTSSVPDDCSFLFLSEENDSGRMQIVGGAPARVEHLNQLRDHYVLNVGSVPAFLAYVTLEGVEAAQREAHS